MGMRLSGIEIENFKSFAEKQYICLSDLSVFLGANSSGKSTALQALLVLKQTMECNSPDEELLLSGKYVALGDFDDVISNKEKNYFSLAVVLKQTEKTENGLENDSFKILWQFKRADDGISAVLLKMDITYENMHLSFQRTSDELYYMFVNGVRTPYSAYINNLIISKYVIHYDTKLNMKAAELLNQISRILIPGKITTVATDEPISVQGIEEFYVRLLERVPQKTDKAKTLTTEKKNLAEKLSGLIYDYGELLVPKHEKVMGMFPRTLRSTLLEFSMASVEDLERIKNVILEHDEYIKKYKNAKYQISKYEGKYCFEINPFRQFNDDEGKNDNLTQLKYALDFYKEFLKNILSKIFFVGPLRENPKGLYNIGFETIPKYVGPTGAYFASVLLHENKKERAYILPGRKEVCTLSDALSEWMIHLNVASSVNVDKKNSFGFSVSIENMEQIKADIMNVGIGTSQVLPVLISVLLSEPGEILVFEQPELHLHPYSQSRLADIIVEFCKQGRRIIVETYSEYFLLRLRYRIVKEEFSNKCTAISFFQNTGGTKVTYADISGFGNINYPDDFRDETQELLNSILDASLERKGLS